MAKSKLVIIQAFRVSLEHQMDFMSGVYTVVFQTDGLAVGLLQRFMQSEVLANYTKTNSRTQQHFRGTSLES